MSSLRLIKLLGEAFFYLTGQRRVGTVLREPNIQSILVVKLDNIGDVVLSTPLLRELRRNFPQAWTTLVVRPSLYNLVETCPYVNEVLTYQPPGARLSSKAGGVLRATQMARTKLWPRCFDLALVPRYDIDLEHATLLAYLSGANFRVGFSTKTFDYKHALTEGLDGLLTHPVRNRGVKHEAKRNLDLLRALQVRIRSPKLELWVTGEDREFVLDFFGRHELELARPVLCLGVGAGAKKRMWPVERYVSVVNRLTSKYGFQTIVVGGPEARELGKVLASQLYGSVVNAAGITTLRETVALMKKARVFIGSDSGPKHLAAAAGTPVVEISCQPQRGSILSGNHPVRFGPWGVPHRVVMPEYASPPCTSMCVAETAHCILSISVDDVVRAADSLLLEPQLNPECTDCIRDATPERAK